MAACAAPVQQGGVYVAPGASERFMLAMRMGYLGTFDREMVPGQVRRAMLEDQLPQGPAKTGRLGDYVLENGHVIATITNVDGTPNGGRLVDLARKPKVVDGLDRLEHDILGQHVVYDTLRTGDDEATNSAFIEVTGRIDQTAQGGPMVTVSTRYDAAPGIDAIVVHTHVKLDKGAIVNDPSAPALLDETLIAKGAGGPIVDTTNGFGATLGSAGAYLLRPMFDGASMTAAAASPRFIVANGAAPTVGDSIVITRVVTPLERPDTGALAVALAKTEGRGIGEVEVRAAPRGRGIRLPHRGDLAFVSSGGDRYDVCDVDTTGEDSHFGAKLPAGQYTVYFQNDDVMSEGARVDIQADRIAFLTVAVSNKASGGAATNDAATEPLPRTCRPPAQVACRSCADTRHAANP